MNRRHKFMGILGVIFMNTASEQPKQGQTLREYQTPAIIYEGVISTRAGSPVGPIAPTDLENPDPIDLFSDQQ